MTLLGTIDMAIDTRNWELLPQSRRLFPAPCLASDVSDFQGGVIPTAHHNAAQGMVGFTARGCARISWDIEQYLPERNVTKDEVSIAKDVQESMRSELDTIDRAIQRGHGALEQVGGAVARERLRDATEAFESAEQQEREIEADYEAWKLLLDQLKEADAAQASNLGQALGPAIASRFQTLTQRRYESVQLNAQLGTDGVVTGGAARPAARLSVGTREQLSTLYRLSLAEYLQATVVLDDQLVQSDDSRMGWFRTLLNEKAHIFQIVVFTCRPCDYLATTSMVPDGSSFYTDTDNGFIRAIDLERALRPQR
jgi:hypothetical protein